MSGFQENLKILQGHKFPSKYLKHSFSLKKAFNSNDDGNRHKVESVWFCKEI